MTHTGPTLPQEARWRVGRYLGLKYRQGGSAGHTESGIGIALKAMSEYRPYCTSVHGVAVASLVPQHLRHRRIDPQPSPLSVHVTHVEHLIGTVRRVQ